MRYLALGLLLMASACGDDAGDGPSDLGSARDLGGAARDLGSPVDLGGDVPDLGGDTPDLGETTDLGTEADAFTPADMFTADDMGTTTSDVPVQCRMDSDCGTGTCNQSAPGGICNGCVDGSCPSGTTCSDFGTCIRDCDSAADCAPGFRCLGSGRCALATPCNATVCPAPYVCGTVGCERPPCEGGSCPSGFTCSGAYCVED